MENISQKLLDDRSELLDAIILIIPYVDCKKMPPETMKKLQDLMNKFNIYDSKCRTTTQQGYSNTN